VSGAFKENSVENDSNSLCIFFKKTTVLKFVPHEYVLPFAFEIFNAPSVQKYFLAFTGKNHRDILRMAIWKLSCARRSKTFLCLEAVLLSTVMDGNAVHFNDFFGQHKISCQALRLFSTYKVS